MINLQGLKIIVTLPGKSGQQLCQDIIVHQGAAIHSPTIAFVKHEAPTTLKSMQHLSEFDWLIFTSPRAVDFLFAALDKNHLSFSTPATIVAVGKTTALRLQAHRVHKVIYPRSNWSSEGVLALLGDLPLKAKKIGIVCGLGGRETLQKVLTVLGAEVTRIEVYERVVPLLPVLPTKAGIQKLCKKSLDPHWSLPQHALSRGQDDGKKLHEDVSVYLCASYTSVVNLVSILGNEKSTELFASPLVVVSDRIKLLAQELGFQRIWVAREVSHASLLEALQQVKEFYEQRN